MPDANKKLEEELREQTSLIAAPRRDLPSVLRRGRQIGRRRRFVASFSGAVVLAAATLIVLNVSTTERPESSFTTSDPSNDSPAQKSETDAAASFSIRTIAQAGLLDPSGDFYDYIGIDANDNGWVATFDARQCIITDVLERCIENSAGDGVLRVELRDDRFVVAAADGPFSEAKRELILGYNEIAAPEGPAWEFPFVVLGGVGGNLVETSGIWTGPIPALEHGEKCRAQLVGKAGDVVWEGETLDLRPPSDEESRSGGILSVGGLSSAIEDSDDALSSEIRNADAKMACDPWNGEGWKPVATGAVERVSGAPGSVAVPVRLRWDSEPFGEAYTSCTVTVFGRDGTVAGRADISLVGPDDTQGPPFDQEQSVPVTVDAGSTPERAATHCSLITAEEFEQE